jgi:hypothetical protein
VATLILVLVAGAATFFNMYRIISSFRKQFYGIATLESGAVVVLNLMFSGLTGMAIAMVASAMFSIYLSMTMAGGANGNT